jgi:sulfoxide reductase heme-binding subunit YedZ
MAFNPKPGQLTAIKVIVFLLALLPFLNLAYGVGTGQAIDPIAYLTHGSGDWALYLLCATLAITPLRRLSGWNWLVRLRRMLGLFVFFYAFVHFLTFFWFDHGFDLAAMWKDVLKRPFITVGFIAFVMLVPLAATSTKGMIRRLGRRWTQLHRLIYPVAALAILHYWWMKSGKHDFEQPIIWGTIVVLLLGLRVWWSRTRQVTAPGSVRS